MITLSTLIFEFLTTRYHTAIIMYHLVIVGFAYAILLPVHLRGYSQHWTTQYPCRWVEFLLYMTSWNPLLNLIWQKR